MIETVTLSASELLQKFRELSKEKQDEALDFISFLLSKVRASEQHPGQEDAALKAESAAEETWGNLALDKGTLMYMAED